MALPARDDYEYLTPALALPPGVYFNPTNEEIVRTYLNGWIAGHGTSGAEAAVVIEDDVYGDQPDVLARRHPPASTRDSDPSWWFRCHCKVQATRGGGGGHRGDRGVATGGFWKLEQTTKEVRCEADGEHLGFKRTFGFYVEHEGEKEKTRWLMEEYTNVDSPDEGAVRNDGRNVLPALYRIYLTPRDPGKKRRKTSGRDVGDDHVDGGPVKAARVMVPEACLHAIAALLSPSSARGAGQEEPHGSFEAPPPPPSGVFSEYRGDEAATSDDDQSMTMKENLLEEAQGSTGGDDSPELRVLVTMDDGMPAWEMGMGGGYVFADTSWIDEHYQNSE
ncbi:NAC domain-containing protein 55-like [Triticum dicoccoides]|nr:NAC domain-containing protein 55-like [Triticum dicoccoides]